MFFTFFRADDQTKPYPVAISPELAGRIENCLKALDIRPVNPKQSHLKHETNESGGINLLIQSFEPQPTRRPKDQPSSVIPWSPPQQNWNPWTACNIDEGYLATATLEQLSKDLEDAERDKMQNDRVLQERVRGREKLPISNMRTDIMATINDNPVVLIRGNTGKVFTVFIKIRNLFLSVF